MTISSRITLMAAHCLERGGSGLHATPLPLHLQYALLHRVDFTSSLGDIPTWFMCASHVVHP
jgi:hypothetical protein